MLAVLGGKLPMNICAGKKVFNLCLTMNPKRQSIEKLAAYYECVSRVESAANLYENELKLDRDGVED